MQRSPAAICILDSEGESALTFRTLAARLATGAGAIYWHIADKQGLLAAASCQVLMQTWTQVPRDLAPPAKIRAVALSVSDAVDVRPWLGVQLARNPLEPAGLQILERVGEPIEAWGIDPSKQFDAATALFGFVLGMASQYTPGREGARVGIDRRAFLETVAARWASLDAKSFSFVRRIAAQLPGHDDREQFLAGIDLILAGIDALR